MKDGIGNYLFDFVGVILIVKDGIRFGNYLFDFVGVVDRQAARKDPHFSKCLCISHDKSKMVCTK